MNGESDGAAQYGPTGVDIMTNAACPLAPLRSMYRSAKRGVALDARAFAAAIVGVIVAGIDLVPVLAAFEPLVSIRLNCIRGAEGAGLVRAALASGGYLAALRMASALGQSDVWAAAMTAHYGPCGTHASRLDADGRPNAVTMAECPEIGRRMIAAAERLEVLLAWNERNEGPTRWEHVIEARRIAA